MARNKNSTALFDVIHAAKKPPRSSPSASIPAPRWWGKDKKLPKPAVAAPAENVGKQRSWLSAAKKNAGVIPAASTAVPEATTPEAITAEPAIAYSPIAHSSSEAVTSAEPADTKTETPLDAVDPAFEVPEAPPKQRFIDRFRAKAAHAAPVEVSAVDEPAAEPVSESIAVAQEQAPLPLPVFYKAAEATQKPEKRMARPPEPRETVPALANGEVRFQLSYGGIAAIVFIVLIALAIAYIAGTHSPLSQASSDDDQPSHHQPVAADDGAAAGSSSASGTSSTSGMMVAVSPVKPIGTDPAVKPDVLSVSPKSPKLPAKPTGPAQPLAIKSTRDIGMLYVVIQSYDDQDLAQKACDFVNRAGVQCTLVKGLSGWAPRDWYSVVGLQPFNKRDPGLEAYERAVTAIGMKFSTNVLNRFQPQAYTWRGDSDAEMQP